MEKPFVKDKHTLSFYLYSMQTNCLLQILIKNEEKLIFFLRTHKIFRKDLLSLNECSASPNSDTYGIQQF